MYINNINMSTWLARQNIKWPSKRGVSIEYPNFEMCSIQNSTPSIQISIVSVSKIDTSKLKVSKNHSFNTKSGRNYFSFNEQDQEWLEFTSGIENGYYESASIQISKFQYPVS